MHTMPITKVKRTKAERTKVQHTKAERAKAEHTTPPITLSQFADAIASLQTAAEFQDGLSDYLFDFGNSHNCYVDFGPLICPDCSDGLLRLLKDLMHDDDDLIAWWCYDLSFGADWEEGDLEDDKGNDIPVQTVERLYWHLADRYLAYAPHSPYQAESEDKE